MLNVKPWQDRAPIWASKDSSPINRREEAMQAEIAELREVIERSTSSVLSIDESENVSTAITIISGFFEHDPMPDTVTEVVSGLRDLLSGQDTESSLEGQHVEAIDPKSERSSKAGLSHTIIRDVLIRHLGWLGAMSWNDDIRAISNDILDAAHAAPASHVLLDDLYEGLHAILGGTDDPQISAETHKLIDSIDAARKVPPVDFNSLQRYGVYAAGKGSEIGPQVQGPYVLVRDVLDFITSMNGAGSVKLAPVPGLKLVVFDVPGEDGATPAPFVIDDKRARTFHEEKGFLASHLEPIYRNVSSHTPVLPLNIDTPDLRRAVNEYRQACDMVQGHAIPQWRRLVEHISAVCASQVNDGPTWEMVQAREQDIRSLQTRIIELSNAGAVDMVGWKRVPTKLTDDMVVAFAEAWYLKKRCFDDPEMDDAYKAMLDAAPDAPTNQTSWRTIVENVLSYHKQGLYTSKVALSKLRRCLQDDQPLPVQ